MEYLQYCLGNRKHSCFHEINEMSRTETNIIFQGWMVNDRSELLRFELSHWNELQDYVTIKEVVELWLVVSPESRRALEYFLKGSSGGF